jgi:DNA repair protein SbcC/Rad50
MIVRRLILENIRSHSNYDIEFPDGRILLSGDIGSGKTSILYALEFGLFGILKGWNDGDTLLKNNMPSGAVELRCEIESRKVVIIRKLKRTPRGVSQGDVVLEIDGERSIMVPTEARSKILELLRYPQEFITKNPVLFRYTIYTPQEKMREILSDDPDIRMNLLRKLFGLDRYQIIRENAHIASQGLKSQMLYIEGQTRGLHELEENQKGMLNDIDDLSAHCKELERDLAVKTSEHENAKKAFAEIESLYASISHKKAQIESLKKEADEISSGLNAEREELESAIIEIETQKKAIRSECLALDMQDNGMDSLKHISMDRRKKAADDLSAAKSRHEVLREKIKENEKEHYGLANRKSIIQERIKNNENNKNSESERMARAKKEHAANNARIESANAISADEVQKQTEEQRRSYFESKETISLLSQRIEQEQNDLKNIMSLSVCPTCRQTVSDEHRQETMSGIKSKIISLEDEKASAMRLSSDMKMALDGMEAKMILAKEIEALRHKNDTLLKEIAESESRIESCDKEIVRLHADIDIQDNSIEAKRKDIDIIRTEMQSYENSCNEIEGVIDKLERIRTMFEGFEKISSSTRMSQQKIAMLSKSYADCIQKASVLKQEISESATLASSYAELKENVVRLQKDYEGLLMKSSMAKARLDELQKRSGDNEAGIIKMKGLKQHHKHMSVLKAFFDKTLHDITRSIELDKSSSIHNHMESQLSKWFSLLIPDLEVSLDDTFTPMVLQSGYEVSFTNLSGGERTSLSIAYRLALNDTINHAMLRSSSGLLILDEPTDGLSSEQMDQVKQLLDQVSCDQMIIVSHEQKIESYVDHIIRVTKNSA